MSDTEGGGRRDDPLHTPIGDSCPDADAEPRSESSRSESSTA